MSDSKNLLVIGYNRFDCIKAQLEVLCNQKEQLDFAMLVLDGPKNARDEAIQKRIVRLCKDTEFFDVIKFGSRNRGCRFGPEWAIDQFFDIVDEGIILEDDCVAANDFFSFAYRMLEQYRHNENCLHIAGNTYGFQNDTDDIVFSSYAQVWGWATWGDKWRNRETNARKLYEHLLKLQPINTLIPRLNKARHVRKVECGRLDAWDALWHANVLLYGFAVFPPVNLITNIGSGELSTHTHNSRYTHLPTGGFSKLTFCGVRSDAFENVQKKAMGLNRLIGFSEPLIALWRKISRLKEGP